MPTDDRDDSDRLQATTETLRQTTKWILTVAAGLGSVLVAGLRFSDLGHISTSDSRFWIASACVLIGLTAIGLVLWQASRLLIGSFDTLRELLVVKREAEKKTPSLPAEVTNPLIRAIQEEREYLFGGVAGNLTDLYGRIRHASKDDRRAAATETLAVAATGGQAVSADTEAEAAAAAAQGSDLRGLKRTAGTVVDFANNWTTKRQFSKLLQIILIAVPILAFAIVGFAYEVDHVSVATRKSALLAMRSPHLWP